MKFSRRKFLQLTAIAAARPIVSQVAWAQTYPTRPVRIIVPFAPAGIVDIAARIIGQGLTQAFGKQFFVENHAGAGGNLGMGNAAKAAPDGHTILFVSSSYVINPSLYAHVPYDLTNDFKPVTVVGEVANALVVHPSVPARTVKELVELIKANPAKYNNYAHAGFGTPPHLSGELFKLATNVDLVPVPFPGGGPGRQSVIAGHTPIMFTTLASAVPLIQDGKLRALAVMSKSRAAVLPDVPTMEEAGFRGEEADTFVGILVPAGTEESIIDLLYHEVATILAAPEVQERFAAIGVNIVGNTPEEFAAQIKAEAAKWARVIRAANIKVE
jgi:tripartite-type tricarboxylate transporter receptor subunit TctC